MSQPQDRRVIFYGCIRQPGHYWWERGGKSSGDVTRPEGVPWERVDGTLTPKTDTRQGRAALHHLGGWTALGVHDYSVDGRPGSNSVFLVNADLDLTEILDAARAVWPKVVDRIGPIEVA